MGYLHELKNGLTTGTDNRHTIEIEKRLVAAQASALYIEFGFGHCDRSLWSSPRKGREISARNRPAPLADAGGSSAPFVAEVYGLADDAMETWRHRSIFAAIRIRL
jgi:hypothetical protein